ncbi:MAG TPA: hypothetical protein VFF06_24790 [Polyangia bacterium]|nr:hypothetical protein [Polyangia bacterium]
MNRAAAERIAQALLYEGYLLYPYRASSVKNRQRWSFAVLYPPGFCGGADPSSMRTECLARGAGAVFEAEVRFLHLVERDGWQAAVERTVAVPEVALAELIGRAREVRFAFPAAAPSSSPSEPGARQEAIEGRITLAAERLDEALYRVSVAVDNVTAFAGGGRDEALLRSFASAHTLVGVRAGELVSLLEPPDALAAAAATCRNVGTWPVLVGDEARRDTMLSSPIILYDHPRVAPESPGDLFDGTEIDEILTLRILTLSDDEKRELRAGDPRGAALLARTEALGEAELTRLHGALRKLEAPKPERVLARGVALGPGDRVRLRPSGRADIFDLALAGMTATIESVEQDYEDRVFVAVTIDDDPGKDLGARGQPGHRFFFRPDEVEPLA